MPSVVVDFPVGSTMLTYTDGLIERRDESLEEGIERLVGVVWADEPEAVCRDVMEALVGRDVPPDDIAVLAVRRDPQQLASDRA